MPSPKSLGMASLLAGATGALLPWWVVRNSTADATVVSERLLSHGPEVVVAWTWASSALMLLGAALLFLRVAAASWRHEPGSWRRDVAIASGLWVAALAAAWAWPANLTFWGKLTFDAGQAATYTLTANPGLGWWLVAAGALLGVWAAFAPGRADPL